MKVVRLTMRIVLFLLIMHFLLSFSYAKGSEVSHNNADVLLPNISSEQPSENKDTHADTSERNNFDVASLLSLLGVGLLKFIDDKLRIKFKDKFAAYKKYLITITIVSAILEATIIICYFGKLGPTSFGNLKNCFLGLIPVIFCVLTLITVKNESNSIILSQDRLEKRINDFTSSGMSPLGMIVGDMDFFGKVYNAETRKKKAKDDITTNSQIKALIDNNIDSIEIVCKIPATRDAKRRIGYLLDEFEGRFHIKFFNEAKFPIPQMRGRIMYKHNEQVVVITKKIKKPSQYEYSEYAVSSLPGGLFADLWRTVWNCSEECPSIIEQCRQEYNTYVGKRKEKVQ